MKIRLGIGAECFKFLSSIASIFKTRVLGDGGTFEAESCLDTTINNLPSGLYDKASLILTPNGFKASKLYSLTPTDGTGDFTF